MNVLHFLSPNFISTAQTTCEIESRRFLIKKSPFELRYGHPFDTSKFLPINARVLVREAHGAERSLGEVVGYDAFSENGCRILMDNTGKIRQPAIADCVFVFSLRPLAPVPPRGRETVLFEGDGIFGLGCLEISDSTTATSAPPPPQCN